MLAYYFYPFVPGQNVREYTKEQLMDAKTVENLFNYCQILEACITKQGWAFLIDQYGYEKLYEIDNISGWINADTLEEFQDWVDYYMSIAEDE
jgi:hypothetical protein